MSRLVTVEVGGSSIQSGVFDDEDAVSLFDRAVPLQAGDRWALAAPGLVIDGRVRGAHHLSWLDTEAWQVLGYDRRPDLSMNDAAAAALGEAVLRNRFDDLLYVGIGTGVGSAIVSGGTATDSSLGHLQGFSDLVCGGCHGIGCLDASIGGHALPTPLEAGDVSRVAALLSQAILRQHPEFSLVVIGGGLPRRYPAVVPELQTLLEGVDVEPTAALTQAKSAAPWGLAHALRGIA